MVVQRVTFFQNWPLAPDGRFESMDSCITAQDSLPLSKDTFGAIATYCSKMPGLQWVSLNTVHPISSRGMPTCTAFKLIKRSSGLKSVLPKPTCTLPALSALYSTLPPLKSLTACKAMSLLLYSVYGLTQKKRYTLARNDHTWSTCGCRVLAMRHNLPFHVALSLVIPYIRC